LQFERKPDGLKASRAKSDSGLTLPLFVQRFSSISYPLFLFLTISRPVSHLPAMYCRSEDVACTFFELFS
jgi:hypothetical protein